MSTYSDDELNDVFDWDLLISSRLNAILCGNQATLDAALSRLGAHLEGPLHRWSLAEGRPLPSINSGTLIVTDLVGSTSEQQRLFLGWLNTHHAVRVITLSEGSLFSFVTAGILLEPLYYRLNPIYCALDPNCSSGSTSLGGISAA